MFLDKFSSLEQDKTGHRSNLRDLHCTFSQIETDSPNKTSTDTVFNEGF